MASTSVSSFVLELPLNTTAGDGRDLSVRLDAARQIYNAVLGECLRVLALMRESRDWRRARAMPKGQDRSDLFKSVIQRFDFKSSMADRYAIACKNNCWVGCHLSSNETQKAALRAFRAVRHYAFGKRGRPRFKHFGELHSVEGKTNKAGIRFRDGAVEWSGLRLTAMLAPGDRWQGEALQTNTKYCRLIRREIRGSLRWSVQLIQEGDAPSNIRQVMAWSVWISGPARLPRYPDAMRRWNLSARPSSSLGSKCGASSARWTDPGGRPIQTTSMITAQQRRDVNSGTARSAISALPQKDASANAGWRLSAKGRMASLPTAF